MKNYTVLGVNAGIGPALFPFRKNLIANIETRSVFHTPNDEQWRINFGKIPLLKVFKDKGYTLISPDIIISTPDCGSGSIFRLSRAKKFGDHKKNKSLMEFFKALRKFQPKLFLFENLPGLWKSFAKERFIDICREYKLIIHEDSVKWWGNSQIGRKRLIIIGIRRDLPGKLAKYFKKPDFSENIKVSWDLVILPNKAFPENPEFGHVREDFDKPIAIYGGKQMTPREIQQEWLGRLKNKSRFYIDPKEGKKFSTAPGVYRNLGSKYPATARKANRQFNRYGLMMSPRELAKIMGIPDNFNIFIDLNKKGYWINKARTCITKGMVYEIPKWFKVQIEKLPI